MVCTCILKFKADMTIIPHIILLSIILIYILRKTNTSEFIKKNVSLPEKFVRFVSGEEVFTQIGERIRPLNDFPEEKINEASRDLIYNHSSSFTDQKILMQVCLPILEME